MNEPRPLSIARRPTRTPSGPPCRLTGGAPPTAVGQPIVETDQHGRVVLAGYPDQRFFVYRNHDGSLLLVPTRAHPA